MKKKKILFIMHSMLGGGTEKVLLTILGNMDYSLFDVELLLIYREGIHLQNVPKNVKVRYLYSRQLCVNEKIDHKLFFRFGSHYGYRFRIKMRIANYYDTIISFMEGDTVYFHSHVMNRAGNNFSWIHTDLLNNHPTVYKRFMNEKEKKTYACMDNIIFVSNDAKKQFEKLYPCNKTEKTIILNPIDYDYISSYRKEDSYDSKDKCFEIVAVGRLEHVKAYDRLVRLAKRLKDVNYNFHITVIGEGSERKKLENLITEYNLENYLSLSGFLKFPYSKMADADLFLMTSLAEGYPLVLCEAFCLGLPVVSTKVTGSIELIDNDQYGILVDHDDESIYQGVKRMIDDNELRLHYHQRSLERAKIFNIQETMKQVFEILS